MDCYLKNWKRQNPHFHSIRDSFRFSIRTWPVNSEPTCFNISVELAPLYTSTSSFRKNKLQNQTQLLCIYSTFINIKGQQVLQLKMDFTCCWTEQYLSILFILGGGFGFAFQNTNGKHALATAYTFSGTIFLGNGSNTFLVSKWCNYNCVHCYSETSSCFSLSSSWVNHSGQQL